MHLGIRHAALPVSDLKRALDFWCNTLGFEPYHVSDVDWAMVCQGGTTLSFVKVGAAATAAGAGQAERQQDPDAPDFGYAPGQARGVHPGHLGVVVLTPEDVDRTREKLQAAGRRCGKPKLHRDGSYGFYFTDPDGNAVELIFIPARSYPGDSRKKPATPAELIARHQSACSG